jgi:hypothetical protein
VAIRVIFVRFCSANASSANLGHFRRAEQQPTYDRSMRTTITIVAALVAGEAAAQVSPPSPTTNNTVSYGVFLPASCPYQYTVQMLGFQIDITVTAGGICLSVGTTAVVPLGTLRAGTYTVKVTRIFAGETTTFTDSFVVAPAAAIPALDRGALLALVAALGALGLFAARR